MLAAVKQNWLAWWQSFNYENDKLKEMKLMLECGNHLTKKAQLKLTLMECLAEPPA